MTRGRRPAVAPALAALACVACLRAVTAQSSERPEPLHVAFSSAMFAGVNVNDARAAIRVWAETIGQSRGVRLETSTEIYDDVDEMRKAVDAGRVSLLGLSVDQYRRLGRSQFGTMLLPGRRGRDKEEFLLLVRRNTSTVLADLRGRNLTTFDGTGYDMSVAWLESELSEQRASTIATFFGSVTKVAKPSRAVLPVFFGQADACLISRYGYELMVELNPQLGRELAVLAASAPMAHGILLFDRRYAPARRAVVLESLLGLHETPRGQQVLSLFGIDRLFEGRPGDLASALDLLALRDRLRGVERDPR